MQSTCLQDQRQDELFVNSIRVGTHPVSASIQRQDGGKNDGKDGQDNEADQNQAGQEDHANVLIVGLDQNAEICVQNGTNAWEILKNRKWMQNWQKSWQNPAS
jgi:hypothetical protein